MKSDEPRRRTGRPSKFSPAIVKTICAVVSRGLNYSLAAEAAGIHRDTLNEWLHSEPGFSDVLKRATAKGIDRRLARIERAAAKGHWQADAWWLERNRPQEWGRKVRVEQAPAPDSPEDSPTLPLTPEMQEVYERTRVAIAEEYLRENYGIKLSDLPPRAAGVPSTLSDSPEGPAVVPMF